MAFFEARKTIICSLHTYNCYIAAPECLGTSVYVLHGGLRNLLLYNLTAVLLPRLEHFSPCIFQHSPVRIWSFPWRLRDAEEVPHSWRHHRQRDAQAGGGTQAPVERQRRGGDRPYGDHGDGHHSQDVRDGLRYNGNIQLVGRSKLLNSYVLSQRVVSFDQVDDYWRSPHCWRDTARPT